MSEEDEPTAAPRKLGRPSRGVRDNVLAATMALVTERGIAAVTTSAVAKRAGASEASIHYHFGSKEALLEAAILTALAPLRDRGLEIPEDPGAPTSERLLANATLLERVYQELVPLLAAVQGDAGLRGAIGPVMSVHDLGPHRAIARVARIVRAEAPGEDAEAIALLLVGACFLRAWEQQMSTHRRRRLPTLKRAIRVLTRV